MAQIMAGDLRKGVTFLYENNIMTVVDFQHVKPGKGAAFVRTKMKNVVTGSVLEKTFNPTEKFDLAHIETKTMEYLYNDGEFYYFMDVDTYEQIPLNHSQVEDALNFVKENMNVTMKFFQGAPFSVEPPNFVELKITVCEPAVVGNTATNATKPATLETGYSLQVPMFVNEGDTIRIDTRTGESALFGAQLCQRPCRGCSRTSLYAPLPDKGAFAFCIQISRLNKSERAIWRPALSKPRSAMRSRTH